MKASLQEQEVLLRESSSLLVQFYGRQKREFLLHMRTLFYSRLH